MGSIDTTCWAIVVAAGSGERFGGPKQYEPLGTRRVLDWSVATAEAACDGVVLVVAPDRVGVDEPGVVAVVAGGASRSASVRAGLAVVPRDVDFVVVHDAARPNASLRLWQAVIESLAAGAAAVIPVVPVADTLWRADAGVPVDRSGLLVVQTPQGFRADVLRRAHASGDDATDDATLVHAIGAQVVTVAGEMANTKVTAPDDLAMMQVFFS